MSLPKARAWFQAHHQRGLVQAGTSSSSDNSGVDAYGFEYDPSPAPHWSWGSANLEIGLVPQGTATTAIRVDGVAQWIDPTPTRDARHGRTIRVTVAGGCPATDRGVADVSNPGDADLDDQLLPATAPSAALTCTYTGLNGRAFTLAGTRRLSAAQAAAVARQIRSMRLGSEGDGPHSCPADFARDSILAFSYPGRADVDIWEHTSECRSTDNGHILSSGF